MHDALAHAHVRVEMHLFPHRGHGATVAPFTPLLRWRKPVVNEVAEFVRSVSAKPRGDNADARSSADDSDKADARSN